MPGLLANRIAPLGIGIVGGAAATYLYLGGGAADVSLVSRSLSHPATRYVRPTRVFAPRRSCSHAQAQPAHSRCALLVHQVGRPANFGGTAIQQFRQPGRLSDEEPGVGARAPGRAADGVQGGEPAESGRSLSRGRGGRRAVSGEAGALPAERVRPRAHVSGDEQQEQRAGDGRELQSQQYGPAGRERFQ